MIPFIQGIKDNKAYDLLRIVIVALLAFYGVGVSIYSAIIYSLMVLLLCPASFAFMENVPRFGLDDLMIGSIATLLICIVLDFLLYEVLPPSVVEIMEEVRSLAAIGVIILGMYSAMSWRLSKTIKKKNKK